MKIFFAVGVFALAACASEPPEATLATTCNGIAAVYRSAATLKTAGKLSTSAITALTAVEGPVKDVCDPTKPPTDLTSALSTAQTILNQISAQVPAQ